MKLVHTESARQAGPRTRCILSSSQQAQTPLEQRLSKNKHTPKTNNSPAACPPPLRPAGRPPAPPGAPLRRGPAAGQCQGRRSASTTCCRLSNHATAAAQPGPRRLLPKWLAPANPGPPGQAQPPRHSPLPFRNLRGPDLQRARGRGAPRGAAAAARPRRRHRARQVARALRHAALPHAEHKVLQQRRRQRRRVAHQHAQRTARGVCGSVPERAGGEGWRASARGGAGTV